MACCPQCAASDLVRVAVTLNGGPVLFLHCRRCEHHWWEDASQGGGLGLTDVLDKVAAAA